MPKCLVCNSNFNPFVNFGEMPIANNFANLNELISEYKFTMQVGFCESCYMVQLVEQPDRERMFHSNYAFYSSTSEYMKQHFQRFYTQIKEKQSLSSKSFVIEIGCNDGILLENFINENISCLGIEPSKNVADIAISKNINVINDFFDESLAKKIAGECKKADAIMSANVICHIPYIHSIFSGVKLLLDQEGIFVFEDPYLGEVIEKNSFDQIYDEHVFLFSALSVSKICKMHGMELIDVEPQVTHGGSMRYFISHEGSKEISENVGKSIANEKSLGLHRNESFNSFGLNINKIKQDLVALLKKLKKQGKKIVAYGATSKSTTVTNFFGIGPELIECIFDTTPIKQNKFSPGVHIPILPYEGFHKSNPDYVLLFAWNHAKEIMSKEKSYMKDKKWITYIPEVKIT